MMTLKRLTVAAAFAAVALAIIAAGAASAMAQGQQNGGPPAPGGTQAANGPAPGEAVVSWQAVASATHYSIGWVAYDDYNAAIAAGRDWLEAFTFVDLANRGQTSHQVARLTPGIDYAFIVGSNAGRYAAPTRSDWASLTLSAVDGSSCPTDAGTGATITPTPTPTGIPVSYGAGDYDADDNGLIAISSLLQLDAIRYDLDGDGTSSHAGYAAAFPAAMPGMGCPDAGCTGYELTVNLDFDTNGDGQINADDSYWNDGAGWQPIGGDHLNTFHTIFDGNGYTIANLYINRRGADIIGLFGVANPDSDIRNIGLPSVSVLGNYYVGGLVGVNYGAIGNAHTDGVISGSKHNVGGLVGRNGGSIANSYASAAVFAGGDEVGGLVGSNGGAISASYATGGVTATNAYISVGGLVGENDGAIAGSYAAGNVNGGLYSTGGLAGDNQGSIAASYATGSVSGYSNVGGLAGKNNTNAKIKESYAIGRVTGAGSRVGGLIGSVVSHEYGAVADSYWNIETSGHTHGNSGSIGKTTAELQAPTENAGIYANWSPDYWDFGTDSQYPVLKYGGLNVAAQRP